MYVCMYENEENVNVAFISQRFYALLLIKGLDLDHNDAGRNKTYIQVNKINNQVFSGHIFKK